MLQKNGDKLETASPLPAAATIPAETTPTYRISVAEEENSGNNTSSGHDVCNNKKQYTKAVSLNNQGDAEDSLIRFLATSQLSFIALKIISKQLEEYLFRISWVVSPAGSLSSSSSTLCLLKDLSSQQILKESSLELFKDSSSWTYTKYPKNVTSYKPPSASANISTNNNNNHNSPTQINDMEIEKSFLFQMLYLSSENPFNLIQLSLFTNKMFSYHTSSISKSLLLMYALNIVQKILNSSISKAVSLPTSLCSPTRLLIAGIIMAESQLTDSQTKLKVFSDASLDSSISIQSLKRDALMLIDYGSLIPIQEFSSFASSIKDYIGEIPHPNILSASKSSRQSPYHSPSMTPSEGSPPPLLSPKTNLDAPSSNHSQGLKPQTAAIIQKNEDTLKTPPPDELKNYEKGKRGSRESVNPCRRVHPYK
jgi:hypothetical protein